MNTDVKNKNVITKLYIIQHILKKKYIYIYYARGPRSMALKTSVGKR